MPFGSVFVLHNIIESFHQPCNAISLARFHAALFLLAEKESVGARHGRDSLLVAVTVLGAIQAMTHQSVLSVFRFLIAIAVIISPSAFLDLVF